jgi:quercetin dioxygenase-like cupin family protein
MLRTALCLSLTLFLFACPKTAEPTTELPAPAPKEAPEPAPEAVPADAPATAKNVLFANIPFKPFNPKKPEGIHVYPFLGDHKKGAFSAIVRMPPGFETPLHTHKAGFSGVSLSDNFTHGPSKETAKALPRGSTFYQPGGEAHYDGCPGKEACHFLVFFEDAVDMTPAEAPAAKPTAVTTMVDKLKWAEVKGGVKMSVIHGNPKEGAFVAVFDFPAGMTTNVHTHTASFSGALVSGSHQRGPSPGALLTLTEGSVWREPAGSPHMEKCGEKSRCIFAGSMDGPLDTKAVELTPAAPAKK